MFETQKAVSMSDKPTKEENLKYEKPSLEYLGQLTYFEIAATPTTFVTTTTTIAS